MNRKFLRMMMSNRETGEFESHLRKDPWEMERVNKSLKEYGKFYADCLLKDRNVRGQEIEAHLKDGTYTLKDAKESFAQEMVHQENVYFGELISYQGQLIYTDRFDSDFCDPLIEAVVEKTKTTKTNPAHINTDVINDTIGETFRTKDNYKKYLEDKRDAAKRYLIGLLDRPQSEGSYFGDETSKELLKSLTDSFDDWSKVYIDWRMRKVEDIYR